jgi:hypothetical protein
MRTAVGAILLIGLAGLTSAETRSVTGQAGVLAEWDLTAIVTEQAGGQWTGPLRLTHVGFCGVDGPQEKTGELRLSERAEGVAVTLTVDGIACTFQGRVKGSYEGVMRCPDRRDEPMMLSIQ